MELALDGLSDLPTDFHEGFFWLLTETIKDLEQNKQKADGSFDWQLTNPSQIAELLSKVRKENIKDVTILAKLNQLMTLVSDSMATSEDLKLLLPESGNTPNPPAVKSEQKPPELKKIKLVASQMTRGKIQELFASFKDYDEETQTQIINISIKKWNSLHGLSPYYAFRHLWKYPTSGFDIIVILKRFLSEYTHPHQVLGYESPEAMIQGLSEWYSGLNNTTESGREYFLDLVRSRVSDDEISGVSRKFLAENHLIPALENLRPFKGQSWLQLFQSEISHKLTYKLEDFECNQVENGKYSVKEPDFSAIITYDGPRYLFAVLNKLNGKLFNSDIAYLNENEGQGTFASGYENESKEFLSIIRGLTLNGDALTKMYSLVSPKSAYINVGKDQNLKDIFYLYMCNHDLTPEESFDLINTPEKVQAFKYCSHIRRNSGSYHDSADFLSVIMVKSIEFFDFKDNETLKLLAELLDDISIGVIGRKITVHRRTDYDFTLGELILRKLQDERPEIHDALLGYMGLEALTIYDVKAFIETFLE